MTRDVKQAVGKPDNRVFIRKCILYGILLAIILFAAPSVFEKIMAPMAADGIKTAWYAVFVPLVACMMLIGLFRASRRRWPLAYMNNYKQEARANDYQICPRCGAAFVLKKRTRFRQVKVGERVTTTTYSDGSKSVNRQDIHENVRYTEQYYKCSNPSCQLEAEQSLSQSHLPWKIKEIRALVLNDDSLLGRKHRSASSLLVSRLLVPILALVIIVACGFTIYNYADTLDGEWTYATVDTASSRSAEEYQQYLLSLDTENAGWHVTYRKGPTDMMSYLKDAVGKKVDAEYTFGCYTFEGNTAFDYRFEGHDAGTGIPDGWYTLTQLNGVRVLIDDTNELIYKEGSEFYNTYAPKLAALTHDQALNVVFSRINGGEHALSGPNSIRMEFIRKDDSTLYSYMLSSDVTKISGGEFRAVTLYPEEQSMEQWFFSYDKDEFDSVDTEGYRYADATPQNDELSKLINKSLDDDGGVTFYKQDEEMLDISVRYFADGYEFEIDSMEDGYRNDLEADMVYRVNTVDKTLTKIANEGYEDEVKTDLPLSEYQEVYDFFLRIVPDTYIRELIDLDSAVKRKEKLGLITVYEMKDEAGNITADLKLMFGLIGEANHYTAQDEYVKIQLEY